MLLLGGNSVMGESTIRPPDRPVRRPYALSVKKKWKRWTASTWVAIGAAVLSLLSVGVSVVTVIVSVHYAGAQKTMTEQDALLKLTNTIAGQLAKPQPRGASDAAKSVAFGAKLDVEAQAGVVLIKDLEHKNDAVAAIEYIEVATALSRTQDSSTAHDYYKKALDAKPHTAASRAEALRYIGEYYYNLDQPATARSYLLQAADVFRKRMREPQATVANSKAMAYVVDAYYQYQLSSPGCATAAKDMQNAATSLKNYTPTAFVQWYAATYNEWFPVYCPEYPESKSNLVS